MIARNRKELIPMNERLAYSPVEFAALFGKSSTWAYRLLYSKKITAIQAAGRLIIPRSEAEKLLRDAKLYTAKPRKW